MLDIVKIKTQKICVTEVDLHFMGSLKEKKFA